MTGISRKRFNIVLSSLFIALGTTVVAAQARAGDAAHDAVLRVQEATSVVRKMASTPGVRSLLEHSKGVWVVPRYGRAALGIGGQGGTGVLLVHRNGEWTGPGFYNFGGISIGAQAGAEGGEIAYILMDSKALQSFGTGNKFAFDADAGLTFVNFSKREQRTAGHGDVVVWSNAKGAFADLSVGVTDVNFDEDETQAYYGRPIRAGQIVEDGLTTQKAENLLDSMPG